MLSEMAVEGASTASSSVRELSASRNPGDSGQFRSVTQEKRILWGIAATSATAIEEGTEGLKDSRLHIYYTMDRPDAPRAPQVKGGVALHQAEVVSPALRALHPELGELPHEQGERLDIVTEDVSGHGCVSWAGVDLLLL